MSRITKWPAAVSIRTSKLSDRVAVQIAAKTGWISQLWSRRGLGTIYQQLGRIPQLGRAECVVEVMPGAFFSTDVFEPYWGPAVVGGRAFEPELMHILRRLATLRPVFIDAGANFGYWSIIATSEDIGCETALAIEASPTTFRILKRNAALNAGKFKTLNRAVSDRTGATLMLTEVENGHSIAHVSTGTTGTPVESITIDDAVREAGLWSTTAPFLIKLDVEGHELPALAGASSLRAEKEHLIVFEDFASVDFEHVRAMLSQGYALYYVSTTGLCSALTPTTIHAAVARDSKAGRSRNFVAVKLGSGVGEIFETWVKGTSRRA